MSENPTEYLNQIPNESGKLLYLDAETADVHFSLGSDRIAAHKNLLAAASDVFKRMFYGPMKEKGDVTINGVCAAAFKEFLQFFYIDRVKLTIENVAEVMQLGDKYNVAKCIDLCVKFLKNALTFDNICTGLSLAILYDHNELLKFCEKRIIENTSAVFKSAAFLECDQQVLRYILDMNLFSCPEAEVFEACMLWVKTTSKQDKLTKEIVQTHFGDLFYTIRFASMKIKDIANLTDPYGFLFTFDEYREIIQMIELPAFKPQFFTAIQRQIPWNEETIVKCDRTILNRPNTFPKSMRRVEATAFSTSEPILLGSIICASLLDHRDKKSQRSSSKLLVDVTIVEISGADVIDIDNDRDDEVFFDEYKSSVFDGQPKMNGASEAHGMYQVPQDQPHPNQQSHSLQMNQSNQMLRMPQSHETPEVRADEEEIDEDDDDDDEEDEKNNDTNNAENDDEDYDFVVEKILCNLKVFLRSKSRTKILLTKSVLARPGFLYEIRIQQSACKHCYNARELRRCVKLEPDIIIRFHPDSLHNVKRYGLVTALEFNRI